MCKLLSQIPTTWYIRFGILTLTITILISFLINDIIQGVDATLFTWHPVIMIIAFAGLMSEGVIHYRLSTAKLERARKTHGLIFGLVSLFAIVALTVIISNKLKIKHEITPHTAHAICGTITLCFLLYQAMSGVSKLRWLWKTDQRIYKKHGKCGIFLIYILGLVTISLGFYEVEDGLTFYIAISAIAILGVLVLHTFTRRKRTVHDVYAELALDEMRLTDLDGIDIDALDFS